MVPAVSFDDHWGRFGCEPGVSLELELLMRELCESLVSRPPDARRIQAAAWSVLSFLVTPSGRTDANCTAVNYFLLLGKFDWSNLPAPLTDVLDDMAGTLHDTISDPAIALNFESTPEQLLARLRSR
jgi:hypothetical protein